MILLFVFKMVIHWLLIALVDVKFGGEFVSVYMKSFTFSLTTIVPHPSGHSTGNFLHIPICF